MADTKEISHITFSDTNTLGVINPLISFNCLIDTDFGLLVLIVQNFFDTSVFSEEFFDNNSNPEDLKYTVYEREDKNPLLLCMKSSRFSDDYYKQFFDEYYKDILDRSMITDLAANLPALSSSGAMFTILCKCQEEIDLLDRLEIFDKFHRILLSDLPNLEEYNQIFIKDYDDYGMDKITPQCIDKQFYIPRYKFNDLELMDKADHEKIILLDGLRSQVTKFDLYIERKENQNNE